ncbi:hypothetical protein BDV24DRAFT_102172 [Aspergillus arachidicola]|uniref:Uncharacterized protein n=1 Tax=Aspergillus arachidicola TaxID=656916 RepID=A0A5N6YKN3_9EURO|nr:hypothetical protein BDV24DRAFT_102172 [Aspergillus arachidicola]
MYILYSSLTPAADEREKYPNGLHSTYIGMRPATQYALWDARRSTEDAAGTYYWNYVLFSACI